MCACAKRASKYLRFCMCRACAQACKRTCTRAHATDRPRNFCSVHMQKFLVNVFHKISRACSFLPKKSKRVHLRKRTCTCTCDRPTEVFFPPKWLCSCVHATQGAGAVTACATFHLCRRSHAAATHKRALQLLIFL